jgi:hypothetical protein
MEGGNDQGVGDSKKRQDFVELSLDGTSHLATPYPLIVTPFSQDDSRCGLAPQASWFIPRSAAAILPRPDLPCTCLEPM